MKENLKKSIKIIKKGKDIKEKEKNQKESKTKAIFLYIIPLLLLVTTGIIYLLFQNNLLLILFGILMFIVLWGWDWASRTCPQCKKWNSVIWEKNERKERSTSIKKKSIIRKNKNKTINEKYTLQQGKCKNCGCVFEMEKGRII